MTADAVREALEPCPFCGEPPMIGAWAAAVNKDRPDATAIECASSLADCSPNPTVTAFTRAEAIAAWNKRPDRIAALTARVAEQTVQRDGWHRRVHELEAQLLEWLHANGPGGWIDDLRQRANAAEETKLTAINGLARIANAAIDQAIKDQP